PARCSVKIRFNKLCGPEVSTSTLRKGYSASKPLVNWRRSSRFMGAYHTTVFSLLASFTRAACRSAGGRRLILARVSSGVAAPTSIGWKTTNTASIGMHEQSRIHFNIVHLRFIAIRVDQAIKPKSSRAEIRSITPGAMCCMTSLHTVGDELDHVARRIVHVGPSLAFMPFFSRAPVTVENSQRIEMRDSGAPVGGRDIERDMRAGHLAAHHQTLRRKGR